jgi:hypothetical protein
VTVVTTPMSKRQLRVRSSASPCEVASITTLSLPAATIRASSSCRSIASGVVLRASFAWTVEPTAVKTVPIWPGWRPAARSISAVRAVTVDFPSVPVTPITVSRSDGRPNHASAASAIARRVRSTTSCGTATPDSSRSTTRPMAPASTAAVA